MKVVSLHLYCGKSDNQRLYNAPFIYFWAKMQRDIERYRLNLLQHGNILAYIVNVVN